MRGSSAGSSVFFLHTQDCVVNDESVCFGNLNSFDAIKSAHKRCA